MVQYPVKVAVTRFAHNRAFLPGVTFVQVQHSCILPFPFAPPLSELSILLIRQIILLAIGRTYGTQSQIRKVY